MIQQILHKMYKMNRLHCKMVTDYGIGGEAISKGEGKGNYVQKNISKIAGIHIGDHPGHRK